MAWRREISPAITTRRRAQELREKEALLVKTLRKSGWKNHERSIPTLIERSPRYSNAELLAIYGKCLKEIVGKHNLSEISPDIRKLYEAVVAEHRNRGFTKYTNDIADLLRKSARTSFRRLMSADNWAGLSRAIAKSSMPELTEMYLKSVTEIANASSSDQKSATTLRAAVLSEWKKRRRNGEFFKWRDVRTPLGQVKISAIQSPEEGMLSAFGYHVGKVQGLPDEVRKLILNDILVSELPLVNGPDYMRQWDEPRSAARLQKLNRTLASLGTNERGRGFITAPEQRQMDLDYLKAKYYTPMKHKFS